MKEHGNARKLTASEVELGMITFVDVDEVRKKRDPGRCYRKAGFVEATPTHTVGGLVALQMLPAAMPAPCAAGSRQGSLFA